HPGSHPLEITAIEGTSIRWPQQPLPRLTVASLMFVWAPLLLAQSAGTSALMGTITDPSNAIIPDAIVTLTNTETNQTRSTTTNVDGIYRFTLLQPGTYRVQFAAIGFKSSEITHATLSVTETAVLNWRLEAGKQ